MSSETTEHCEDKVDFVEVVLKHSENEDWICDHEEFPFCDCLATYASQSTTPNSQPSLVQTNASVLPADTSKFVEDSPKYFKEPKTRPLPKRQNVCRPLDILSSSSGNLARDSILEVLEETEENDIDHDSDTDGADDTATDTENSPDSEHLLPIEGAMAGARRASIVITNSRRSSIILQPEPVRIAVFGKDGVGKSALIVRLVTGRFIGEYDPSMEAIYNYQIPVAGHDLPLQVMDTAGTVDVCEEGRDKQVSWGEGFMLVFSLTSHSSLLDLQHIRRVLVDLSPGSSRPLLLVGNKADLHHAREVTSKEILDLTDLWGCDYFEVSAAEPWDVVVRPFLAIYQAVLESRRS